MKNLFQKIVILVIISGVTLVATHQAQAAENPKEITSHTGKKVMVVGEASAIATWAPVDGASSYNVYYRPAYESKWVHGVYVPAKGTSLTINYLGPAAYYYKVGAMVADKEVWSSEKMLKNAHKASGQPVPGTNVKKPLSSMVKPVPSVVQKPAPKIAPKATTRLGGSQVAGITTQTGSQNTEATISWTNPGGVSKYHIYYWSAANDQHAVRNLESKAGILTIGSLTSGKTYWYRVQAIGFDGKARWATEEMRLK